MAACSYSVWGLFPLYFKSISNVAPMEILAHRILWAMPFLLLIIACRTQWAWIPNVIKRPKVLGGFIASALLLSCNWFIYIWAVNNGHVIDSSLGYFINPIVNVLLGFILLKERLRPIQWLAVGIAGCGVSWLALQSGHMPWISLALAISFGIYGLLRKTAALGALEGLSLETIILFPCALAYVTYLSSQGASTFTTTLAIDSTTTWLLLAAGPITAIPLLLFAAGARLIPMSTLGLLQYIAPSIQLLLGVWLFHEPFNGARLAGFVIIWSALILYSAEGLWRAYQQNKQRMAAV
ncbi:rarD: protein RarD [Solimicrobium silvestre]|uniref:RarD: protein RarD n=2 Tax=Solimicrobium silvestre TaxID=2099400 RepID=A0A2S9GXA5_9BURK|nr:rarD: protein RarD [Solimicrobium silvestre]